MIRITTAACLIVLVGAGTTFAQSAPPASVHSLQNFFRDATLDTRAYGEGLFEYASYDFASAIQFGAQASAPIAERLQLGGRLSFLSFSPDEGDGESGLADILVSGRYSFRSDSPTRFAAGASLTLPVGSEDIGEGNTDIGLFGAVRHPASPQLDILGTVGLDFLEQGNDRETSLSLGGGVAYASTAQITWIGELSLQTEGDYALLSGGIDYATTTAGHLRGAVGLGLDDGAPDVMIHLGYLGEF